MGEKEGVRTDLTTTLIVVLEISNDETVPSSTSSHSSHSPSPKSSWHRRPYPHTDARVKQRRVNHRRPRVVVLLMEPSTNAADTAADGKVVQRSKPAVPLPYATKTRRDVVRIVVDDSGRVPSSSETSSDVR